MFITSYSNYMKYGYPLDELKPISCSGMSTWGNYSLTLIDSLDTLYVMNMHDEFKYSIELILKNFNNFNFPTHVSVFESNIRILGGLLSAHLLALKHDWYLNQYYLNTNHLFYQFNHNNNNNNNLNQSNSNQSNTNNSNQSNQSNQSNSSTNSNINSNTNSNINSNSKQQQQHNLLTLCIDIANRLLPAFNTPTGIPYGMIHFIDGVLKNESNITSTAGGGTFILEFGLLSYLTGDLKYYEIAKKATLSIFKYRDLKTNLIGNHINIMNGEWIHRESGIGASIDSYFEYLYKGFILFKDEELLNLFKIHYQSILKYVYKNPWYSDVDMKFPKITFGLYNSLASFWPGVQALYGNYEIAKKSIIAIHGIWRKYGSIPEGFNILISKAQKGQLPYPLRPELIESIYHLFKFDGSRDSNYLYMARDFYTSLEINTKTKCGYAVIDNVETLKLNDRMESFFLSETLKYLYLIFDFNNFVHYNNQTNSEELLFTFNTEAHLIPLNLNAYLKKYDPYFNENRFLNDFSKKSTIFK
ncbi:predicted protein [Naegleria gruberi]|uniref:alpha-1,2-Mannosidase n=1 Tax=Naegleria gruberi TaxID=5762 RepID=D2VGB7_NAEGR|nr:uncharacterized protein NAEGRDRAFT_67921 [Naegleria gruberi]EFC44243.1 predicted protein [Naegleria gruberi]|eukprot:XP_002676987.1 predicted protein [Naegleria gruberi strain NEG-M]